MSNIDNSLKLFRELITCIHELYSWTYTPQMRLVQSNCPNELIFDTLFTLEQSGEIFERGKYSTDRPVVLTNSFGLMWIADFENDDKGLTQYIHLLGPAFYDDISMQSVEKSLRNLNLSASVSRECIEVLKSLPVISAIRFYEYGIMLHYCLTDDKMSLDEFQYPGTKAASEKSETEKLNVHGTWAVEQSILKLVEDGNLDYHKKIEKLGFRGSVGKLSLGDPIRQMKNQNIVFTALCTRAAIKGGLSPETAYTLSDSYIQKYEALETMADLVETYRTMADDFVYRVHQAKLESGISLEIRKCCDYIQLNVNEKLDATELAKLVGYNDNYLSQKFKREMNQTLFDYIISAKIEQAKLLLLDSDLSIQEIGEQLGFNSQSYFGAQFKKKTKMTPSEYKTNIEKRGTM